MSRVCQDFMAWPIQGGVGQYSHDPWYRKRGHLTGTQTNLTDAELPPPASSQIPRPWATHIQVVKDLFGRMCVLALRPVLDVWNSLVAARLGRAVSVLDYSKPSYQRAWSWDDFLDLTGLVVQAAVRPLFAVI